MTGKLPETPRNSDIKSAQFVYDNNEHVFNDIVEEGEHEASFSMETETRNEVEKAIDLSKVHTPNTADDFNVETMPQKMTDDQADIDTDLPDKTPSSDTNIDKSQDNLTVQKSNDENTSNNSKDTSVEEICSERNVIEILPGAVLASRSSDDGVTNDDDDFIADRNDASSKRCDDNMSDEITVINRSDLSSDETNDNCVNDEHNISSPFELNSVTVNTSDKKPSQTDSVETKQDYMKNIIGNTFDKSGDNHSESGESSKNLEDVPL